MSAAGGSPLAGLRAIELCDETGAWAGKLLADAGADVIKVEPPGGDASRRYEPFYRDRPGPDRSLYFWHYNTSKRAITLDLEQARGRDLLRRLLDGADFFIETTPPGRLAGWQLDYPDLAEANPRLIMASITPFGRADPRSQLPVTDLTVLARGGPVWSCGYDDHSLPPVRGGGNQGYQTACHFAYMSALVALLYRDHTGRGQHIDVNMHAAQNVTTEAATQQWLVAEQTVQRQTGRHATVDASMPTQVLCSDGRYVNTGVPARRPEQFRLLHEWLERMDLLDELPEAPLLLLGAERTEIDMGLLGDDPELRMIFAAGREATVLLASRLTAYEYFEQAQQRGFPVGAILAPEEVLEHPQFIERGFVVEVEHPELGASFRYPGAPYRMNGSPVAVRHRAPLLGEHTEAVLGELGLSPGEIEELRTSGVL